MKLTIKRAFLAAAAFFGAVIATAGPALAAIRGPGEMNHSEPLTRR